MFEHFTFGAQAQTAYLQQEDVSASPTDCSFPLSSPPPTSYFEEYPNNKLGGINDIVHKFSRQTIQPDGNECPNRSIWSEHSLPSPDFDNDTIDDEYTQEELTYVSTNCGMVTLPSTPSTQSLPNLPHPRNGTVACRRLQRQLNVQLQSCNNHIKNINSLVEDMISTNSQCHLHRSSSRPSLTSPAPGDELILDTTEFEGREISPDEDEGFAEMEDPFGIAQFEAEMSLRRASTPSGISKYSVIRWRKSAECVGASGSGQARRKVKCLPRMRRRRVNPVPENDVVA